MEHHLRLILRPQSHAASLRVLVAAVICGGAFYGATMGAYALFESGDWAKAGAQMLFSALKVPLLLGLSALLCWPTMRVFYALFGLGREFETALRALLLGQAVLALILASLAPLTLVFYASNLSYRGALLLHAATFFTAGLASQSQIRRVLGDLLRRDARHGQLLKIGFGLWCFVALQLGWNLRPFVGDPNVPAQFFRGGFSNAYEMLWRIVVK